MIGIKTAGVLGGLALASLLATIPASAEQAFGHGGRGRGHLLSALGLSDEQREQIHNIFVYGRDSIRPLHQQLQEKRTALREAAATSPFDEGRIRSLAQELSGLQAELTIERARLANQLLGLLTSEQKARLEELRQQRQEQFKEWRERRFSNPG